MRQQLLNISLTELNCDKALSVNGGLMARIFNVGSSIPCDRQPFRSSIYAMLLITKGKLKMRINFLEKAFSYREILFVFPDSVYEILDNENSSFICIYFSKNFLRNSGVFFNNGETYKIFNDSQIQKFSLSKEEYSFIYYDMLALNKKLNASKDIPQIHNIIKNCFLELVYDIFLINNKRKKNSPVIHDSRSELTNKFLTLLSENFIKEKRVSFYANCLRITPRHLSQVVKQVTNRTAGELIDEMIIREAKLLLTSHELNISEVAEQLQFITSSFFGKYFKKRTGVSPSEYKLSNNIAI